MSRLSREQQELLEQLVVLLEELLAALPRDQRFRVNASIDTIEAIIRAEDSQACMMLNPSLQGRRWAALGESCRVLSQPAVKLPPHLATVGLVVQQRGLAGRFGELAERIAKHLRS